MWQAGPGMREAGARKSKKSSGETSMNVQNWPSLEGLGRHPALETLAVGQAGRRGDRRLPRTGRNFRWRSRGC